MSIAEATREYTLEELLALDDGKAYELTDGQLEELPVSNLASNVGLELGWRLRSHAEPERLGRLFGSDAYFPCFPWMPTTGRNPDL